MIAKKVAQSFFLQPCVRQLCRLKSSGISSPVVGKLFFEPKIQDALKEIANVGLEEVFTVKKTGERLKPPEYKFMTDAELKQSLEEAAAKADKWKQMPPVIDAHLDSVEIIAEDAALDGHDEHGAKFVFTDITYGLPERERLIVVREPDGTLQKADWGQRHRVNQIYSPRLGREYSTPPMFEDEQLELLLNKKDYKFILDRACLQFEPDDPEYVRVVSTTYSRVAKDKGFNQLRTTRHFGSLVFYLVFNKQIDSLLLDYLQRDRIGESVSVINLYHMIHPTSKSAQSSANLQGIDLISNFIQQDVNQRSVLELALSSCSNRLSQQQLQSEVLEAAHGVK